MEDREKKDRLKLQFAPNQCIHIINRSLTLTGTTLLTWDVSQYRLLLSSPLPNGKAPSQVFPKLESASVIHTKGMYYATKSM